MLFLARSHKYAHTLYKRAKLIPKTLGSGFDEGVIQFIFQGFLVSLANLFFTFTGSPFYKPDLLKIQDEGGVSSELRDFLSWLNLNNKKKQLVCT